MPRTVRIFLPSDLDHPDRKSTRHTSDGPDTSTSLLGWAAAGKQWGSNDELLIVVAGASTECKDKSVSREHSSPNGRVPPLQTLGSFLLSSSHASASGPDSVEIPWKGKGRQTDSHTLDLELTLRLRPSHSSQGLGLSSPHSIDLCNLTIKGQDVLADPTTIVQVFFYRQPHSRVLQFLSLSPVPTPPAHAPEQTLPASTTSSPADLRLLPPTEHDLQVALEKSVAADPDRRSRCQVHGIGNGAAFRLAIDLINEVASSLHRLPGGRPKDRPAEEGIPGNIVLRSLKRIHVASTRPLVGAAVLTSTRCIRILRRLLNARAFVPFHRKRLCFIDVSVTAKQLDVRLNQLLIWPQLSHKLRKLRISGSLPTRAISPSYMSVWNGIWLVANDLILGRTVGHLLRTNKGVIAALLSNTLHRHTVVDVIGLLDWLGNWPAGLKLNTELSRFFGDMYSGTTQLWARFILQHEPHSRPSGLGLGSASCIASIIDFVGMCGQYGGLTLILAMSVDLMTLWTLHLHLIYLVSRAIVDWFVYGIDVLFQVFRGKKRNGLRGGRVDDSEYELDERLLGTILFTLLVFLFPTVGVYYLPFGLAEWARGSVVSKVVELGLAMLNELPLFGLMLWVKDPLRVPAGVELEEIGTEGVIATSASRAAHVRVFRIHSIPAPLSHIFGTRSRAA